MTTPLHGPSCASWAGPPCPMLDIIHNCDMEVAQAFSLRVLAMGAPPPDPVALARRGRYVAFQFEPLSEHCSFLIDGYRAGGTSTATNCWWFATPFVHTKPFGVPQLFPSHAATVGGFPHHSCTPSSPSVPQLIPSHAATQPLPLIYPRRKRKGEDWNHYMCELGMQCILDGDPLLAGFDEKGINNIRRALNRIRESDPSAYLKFQALEASLTEACIELQRDSMLY